MAEPQKDVQKEFRHIVRVLNTDLDGNKPLGHALLKMKGVSFMMSNAICLFSKVPASKKAGDLSLTEVSKIEAVIKNPKAAGIPVWMFNRRKDYETGEDMHMIGADLKYQHENDLKILKKIRCYKGIRHAAGLPVRGQSTKSNFRKKKGRKGSLGVVKKKK